MKGSEQRDILILGKMQLAVKAMENAIPNDEEFRSDWHELSKEANILLVKYWNKMDELVSEDDT